ncbi:HD domain-containing protein [Duganella sp. PWIR1]
MPTKIEETLLYKSFSLRISEMSAAPNNLLSIFNNLRERLEAEGKYIVTVFPEYTPHDWVDHISNLFSLADRLLGQKIYDKLRSAELTLLVFGLASHDWGMVVGDTEIQILKGSLTHDFSFAMLPGEPNYAIHKVKLAKSHGVEEGMAWQEYLRETSGLRSGARLRQLLAPTSIVFAEAVAKIAEGHTLDTQEIRDPNMYPNSMSVFGEAVNLAAVATYVRLIDLLDIGEDRTPYVLWRFIAPKDRISKMHWERHRALSPISVKQGDVLRRVVVTGTTYDPETYAALADLQSWIESQFEKSINTLRTIPGDYDVDLDSRIDWTIHAVGFEPLKLRFELDGSRIMQLLSSELYDRDALVFLRELLQNSVDAIDTRVEVLRAEGALLRGEIDVKINTDSDGLWIEWRDNGIGMDEKILRSFFCKIGHSWYRSKEARNFPGLDAISQFGVGILSCFAVSDEIQIETRRDPNVTDNREGFLIEIPARDSYFRIKRMPAVPVGTCIRMKIIQIPGREISKNKIHSAIKKISRFVKHNIKIDVQGMVANAGRLGEIGEDERRVIDFIIPVDEDSAEFIRKNTKFIEMKIGGDSYDYDGIYKALFPNNPSEVRSTVNTKVWNINGKSVNFNSVIFQSEQAVFLKGVQTGSVAVRRRGGFQRSEFSSLLMHSDWAMPTLLLNLKRPSLADVDLSRSEVNVKNDKLISTLHCDIAKNLVASFFGGFSQDPAYNALILGTIACFCGIPPNSLLFLLPIEEIPVLVMTSQKGFQWKKIGEVIASGSFIEAPFEFKYAWNNQYGEHSLDVAQEFKWGGSDALILELSSKRQPWLSYSLEVVRTALDTLGWRPTGLRLVTSPSSELVPLVCRTWTNDAIHHLKSVDRDYDDNKVWKSDSPELFAFPEEFNGFASIGSRYWNLSHKKIRAIVDVLKKLRFQVEEGIVSEEVCKKYRYLTSHDFYGYIVPSRKSGTQMAMTLPNKLLDLANEGGLEIDYRFELEDFFPNTAIGYENPYHYPLGSWGNSDSLFGHENNSATIYPSK